MLHSVYAALCECCTLCMLHSVYAALCVCCTLCKLHSVYAALCVCCTLCKLHSVYPALCVCCTLCMLHSVYAALCVCCTLTMLHWVYAAPGVCCTGWMLHWVYAALCVCCTRCMKHSVYAALSGNSWSRHKEIHRSNLTFCSCHDGRVVDREVGDGGWRWELYRAYEQIWEMMGTTCLNCLKRPSISGITRRSRSHTRCSRGFKLTWTRNSIKSQSGMMISPISSDLSLSCAQLHHHLTIGSWVIPVSLSMPLSWAHTEYCIHQEQHRPKIDNLPLPVSFSSLGGYCFTALSTFQQSNVS